MICDCGLMLMKSENRLKDYQETFKKIEESDIEWKKMVRENVNLEKQFRRLIELQHIVYCKGEMNFLNIEKLNSLL